MSNASFSPKVAAGFRTASAVSQRARPEHARSGSGSMISLESWWWPERPARVPTARTAGLLAGLGAALFGVSAVLLKTGTLGWDQSLFRLLNEVPAAAASVLTPLSRLFLPAGIITVVVLIVVYVLARNRSILPVLAGAAAAGVAWMLAHVAKAIADRTRPYLAMADAVLRQQPAHGTSFPSSHTAVTLAIAIALIPFLARPLAATGIGYAVLTGWSRVYLGVHYPLDILGGAGIGMAAAGVISLALRTLLLRAGRAANGHDATTKVRASGAGAEPQGGSDAGSAIVAGERVRVRGGRAGHQYRAGGRPGVGIAAAARVAGRNAAGVYRRIARLRRRVSAGQIFASGRARTCGRVLYRRAGRPADRGDDRHRGGGGAGPDRDGARATGGYPRRAERDSTLP